MDYIIIYIEYPISPKSNLYFKHKRHYNTFNNCMQSYDPHVVIKCKEESCQLLFSHNGPQERV